MFTTCYIAGGVCAWLVGLGLTPLLITVGVSLLARHILRDVEG